MDQNDNIDKLFHCWFDNALLQEEGLSAVELYKLSRSELEGRQED